MDRLGNYRMIRRLGAGAMGEVWLTEHAMMRVKYAVKVLKKDLSDKAGFREQFAREAHVMATLKHPHIVQVHNLDDNDGVFYIAMDFVSPDGSNSQSLDDLLKVRGGRLAPDEAARILSEICEAVGHAHGQGVIHRDLKPSNVLVEEKGHVKVSDFGLAKMLGADFIQQSKDASILGDSGQDPTSIPLDEDKLGGEASYTRDSGIRAQSLVGTFRYMPPEVQEGGEWTPQGDIYSLGMLAYVLLTGRRPGGLIRLPSRVDSTIPKWWDALIECALEEKPAERFPSAADMLFAIGGAGASSGRAESAVLMVRDFVARQKARWDRDVWTDFVIDFYRTPGHTAVTKEQVGQLAEKEKRVWLENDELRKKEEARKAAETARLAQEAAETRRRAEAVEAYAAAERKDASDLPPSDKAKAWEKAMAVCVPAAYRVSEISARVEHWRQEAAETRRRAEAVEAYAVAERKDASDLPSSDKAKAWEKAMAVCKPAAYRVPEISARVEHWRQEDHKRAQEKKQAEAAVEAYAASERKWAKLKEDEAAEAARLAEEDEAERLFQCVFYDEAVDDEAVDQASATITRKRKKIFIAVSLMIAIGAGAMFYAWGAHKEQRLEAAKIAFAQLQYEDTRDTRDIRDTSNLQPRQRIIMWQEYLKKFGDTEYKTFHTIDRIKELENLAPRWEAAEKAFTAVALLDQSATATKEQKAQAWADFLRQHENSGYGKIHEARTKASDRIKELENLAPRWEGTEKAFTAVALLDQSATATKEQKAQAWADFLRQHENSGYGKIPEARTKATDWNKKIALEKAEPAFNTALALEQSATATKEQKAQAWVTALAVCRAAEHRVREAEARLARWKVEVEQAPYSEQAGCGLNLEMVWIPPGAFDMGSPDSENGRSSGEGPVHRVTLDGFLLGKTEVTQAQYEKIAGTNPSSFKGDGNLPVENVSWNDAVSFCKKLSGKSGRTFTLPTEAQWEYACRAGSSTQFCFGGSNSGFGDYAWFNGNSGGNTHPVRTKQANAFGLCDMHGNVWEWCRDWYDEGFYKMSGATARNPENTTEAAYRVLRGGGWFSSPQYCRSADRLRYEPGYSFDDLGFRVAAFPAAGQ